MPTVHDRPGPGRPANAGRTPHIVREAAREALVAMNEPASVTLRPHPRKLTADALAQELQAGESGIQVERGRLVPDALIVRGIGDPSRLAAVREGRATPQDQGSQAVVTALAPHLGYAKAAALVKRALAARKSAKKSRSGSPSRACLVVRQPSDTSGGPAFHAPSRSRGQPPSTVNWRPRNAMFQAAPRWSRLSPTLNDMPGRWPNSFEQLLRGDVSAAKIMLVPK